MQAWANNKGNEGEWSDYWKAEKQPRPWIIISKMGDHVGSMYLVFLWLAEILAKLGKFANFASSVLISKNLNCLWVYSYSELIV